MHSLSALVAPKQNVPRGTFLGRNRKLLHVEQICNQATCTRRKLLHVEQKQKGWTAFRSPPFANSASSANRADLLLLVYVHVLRIDHALILLGFGLWFGCGLSGSASWIRRIGLV